MDKLKLIKAKNKNKYPLDDEKERGVMQDDVDWLIEQVDKYQKSLLNKDIKFIVEDEGGYKHGTFSKPEDAEEHAKETADDRRIDLFIKKVTTEIIDCVIPD